jgi:hypothetical protein
MNVLAGIQEAPQGQKGGTGRGPPDQGPVAIGLQTQDVIRKVPACATDTDGAHLSRSHTRVLAPVCSLANTPAPLPSLCVPGFLFRTATLHVMHTKREGPLPCGSDAAIEHYSNHLATGSPSAPCRL